MTMDERRAREEITDCTRIAGERLTIDGLVERPLTITVEEVRRLPHHVLHQARARGHGDIIEPHEWSGVPLLALLLAAEPLPEARFVVAHGDGMAVALPLITVTDTDPLVADRLNGSDVSAERGGPLRLVLASPRLSASIKRLDGLTLASDPPGDGPVDQVPPPSA